MLQDTREDGRTKSKQGSMTAQQVSMSPAEAHHPRPCGQVNHQGPSKLRRADRYAAMHNSVLYRSFS